MMKGGWVVVKNVQDVNYTYSLLFDKMAKERKRKKTQTWHVRWSLPPHG